MNDTSAITDLRQLLRTPADKPDEYAIRTAIARINESRTDEALARGTAAFGEVVRGHVFDALRQAGKLNEFDDMADATMAALIRTAVFCNALSE